MKTGTMENLPPLPEKAKSETEEARREEGSSDAADVGDGDDDTTLPLVNDEQIGSIRSLLKHNAACILPATFAEMLARFGKSKIAELNVSEAAAVIEELQERIRRQQDAADQHATIADSEPSPEANGQSTESESVANPAEPGSVTDRQFNRVSELVQAVGWPKDRRDEYLHRLGINSFRSLSFEQAGQLVEKLEGALAKFQQQGTPKN